MSVSMSLFFITCPPLQKGTGGAKQFLGILCECLFQGCMYKKNGKAICQLHPRKGTIYVTYHYHAFSIITNYNKILCGVFLKALKFLSLQIKLTFI